MSFLEISASLTINLDEIKGFERTEGGTRFFIELDDVSGKSVLSEIPYDAVVLIVKKRSIDQQSMARNIEQLALHQTRPTP